MSILPPRRILFALCAAAALSIPVLPAVAAPSTEVPASGNGDGRLVFDVTSDVQGDLVDWGIVLDNYASFEPADALIVNGDIVAGGKQEQYDDFFAVLDSHAHAPTVLFSMGNHEYYAWDGSEPSIERYKQNTGMPGVYWRTEIDGVPVLSIGSTEQPGKWAVGNQVVLGDE